MLARNVAVHVIPVADPRAAAALTAARTSATVSDGRILRVLDALQEGDRVSVVHEWGSGLSLDRLVGGEPLPARRAAWLVREVAEAIAVAHRHGVAHGRLLPENVMVNDAGSVKLAGFVVDGVLLGRSRASSGENGARPAVPPLSDHESDVRNLAGLLYAALTGRWPGSPASVLPPAPPGEHGSVCRPRQVRSGVPRALDLLCDRVLNGRDRGGRSLESAAEAGEALSVWLGEPVPGSAVASAGMLLGDELHPWGAADLRDDDQPDALDPEETQAWQPPSHDTTGDVAVGRTAGRGATVGDATRPVAPLVGTAAETAAPARTQAPAARRAPAPVPVHEPARSADRSPAGGAAGTSGRPSVMAPDRSDVPVHWGPDRPEERPVVAAEPGSSGGPWLRLAAVLAVLMLAVLAVVVAFDIGSSRSGDPGDDPTGAATSPSATPSRPVALTVTSFDPDDRSGGPPEENPDLVPLATDGDPATAWTTETYDDGPPLAPYKRGLGLLLDLGRPTPVKSVDVTLDGVHDLTLFAAPQGAAPTDVTGLSRVAREAGVEGRVRIAPDAVTARWLVVWLTALPASGSGFQGRVGEVVVRS